MPLDRREIAIVKGMLRRGDLQHHIAAYFGINSGRIAEINTGQTGADVEAATPDRLPPPGPYLTGRSSLLARDVLVQFSHILERTIAEIDRYERRSDEGRRK